MPCIHKPCGAGLLFSLCLACTVCYAQDLTPRAYVITPARWNAVILTYTYFTGSILFNQALPITGASGNPSAGIFSLYHSLNFFGRSANITASLPYGVGHFQGKVLGTPGTIYRSGLLDSFFRFSVNLKGGPSMSPEEFRTWRQKTLIGTSFTLVAPTGQYDPSRLVNQSSNRWAFKTELGLSHRRGHWILDTYGGVWFFTTNPDYLAYNPIFSPHRSNTLSQNPVGAFEGHLSYDVKHNPRFWFSLDGNFWYGGSTSVNGKENFKTLQENSRVGFTASVPITRHQSLKFSYSNGDYVVFGGNYQNVSVAWQYFWLGRRAANTLP